MYGYEKCRDAAAVEVRISFTHIDENRKFNEDANQIFWLEKTTVYSGAGFRRVLRIWKLGACTSSNCAWN